MNLCWGGVLILGGAVFFQFSFLTEVVLAFFWGWGCIQDWGYIQADTVFISYGYASKIEHL